MSALAAVSSRVKLVPRFPMEYDYALFHWLNCPRAPNFDDYGPTTPDSFYTELKRRVDTEFTWGIYFDDNLVGFLGAKAENPFAVMLHGMVMRPSYRRRGLGMFALVRGIAAFRDLGYNKFMVSTFADNEAILNLLSKLNFRQEGYITAATLRDGKPVDMRILCWSAS